MRLWLGLGPGLALGLGLGLGLGSGLGVRVRARGHLPRHLQQLEQHGATYYGATYYGATYYGTSRGICSSWSSMAPSKRAQKSCGCSAAVALSEARQAPHV